MIFLASSSQTRAKILRQSGINFEQIFFNYDESGVDKNLPPHVYVQKIVAAKKEQFLKANSGIKNVVFADSVVVCDGKILGKAKDEKEAFKMLKMQSENTARIVTAMIFLGEKFELFNVSFAEYKFAKFDEADLQNYLSLLTLQLQVIRQRAKLTSLYTKIRIIRWRRFSAQCVPTFNLC